MGNRSVLYPLLMIMLILFTAAFYILTIRGGHSWGGDFSLYIAHAKNIATVKPYAETGYINNPYAQYLSPKIYPPIFPFILSPVYKIWGLNLYAMKVIVIISFIVFLLFYYRYCLERFNSPVSYLGAMATIAFNPIFWYTKDSIISDIPFMVFIYAFFVLMDQIGRSGVDERRRIIISFLAGFSAYLAYGTRSIGLLLIPALIVRDIVRLRSICKTTIIITTIFIFLYLTQNIVLHSDQSYSEALSGFPANFKIIFYNLYTYVTYIVSYWQNGFSQWVARFLFVITAFIATIGYIVSLRKGDSVGDFFLPMYLCLLMLLPFHQGIRYLLPVIPLYIVYIFHGVDSISKRLHFFNRKHLLVSMLCFILLSYLGEYSIIDFGNYSYGVEKIESVEMFNFIRHKTPEKSVVIFRKPRVLALFTDRQSSTYHRTQDPKKLWDYIKSIKATYIVNKYAGSHLIDRKEIQALIDHNRAQLALVFENKEFRIYQIINHDLY